MDELLGRPLARLSERLDAAFRHGGRPGNHASVFRMLQEVGEEPEAHHVPMHREFTRQLLEPLHDLGFHTLALETLTNLEEYEWEGHPFESRGSTTFEGGYYSMEPAFGVLIREALALGLALLPYEVRRETAQAEHLIRFLDENPDEKLLVHLGYAHLWEAPAGGNAWMACRRKRRTGIDPLTIDQTRMSPRSEAGHEAPAHREACRRFAFERPSILRAEDGTPWSGADLPGLFDLTVFHPPHGFVHDRPRWLGAGGSRQPVELPDHAPRPAGDSWFLVQALVAGEDPALTIPADQFVLRPDSERPTLHLPAGVFTLRVLDRDAGPLWTSGTDTVISGR